MAFGEDMHKRVSKFSRSVLQEKSDKDRSSKLV